MRDMKQPNTVGERIHCSTNNDEKLSVDKNEN